MSRVRSLRRACVACVLSFAVAATTSGCGGGSGSSVPQADRAAHVFQNCTTDVCGGGGGGGTGGATPINDSLTDSNNNVENISWDGYNAHPVYGSVQLANGGSGSSASATVPNSTATSMTETVTVPNGATVQVPLQVDAGTPPATETYPNGMTVTQDSTNGTATATQTDANGVTWTVQASINSDDTMATVNVTSTAGDSFTKLVPVNNDMLPGQYLQSKGRSAQSATRSTRAWSEAQQSGVARGVAMAAMGILVLGGAPLAAAAIGVAVGVAMVAQAARGKP